MVALNVQLLRRLRVVMIGERTLLSLRPALPACALLVGFVLAAGACGTGSETNAPDSSTSSVVSQPGPSSSAPVEPVSVPDPSVHGAVQWGDQSKVMELGDGWTIRACEGDAPLLCVNNGARTAGVLEGSRLPVASIPVFDSEASDAENLRSLAADFVASVRSDRALGCPEGYAVQTLKPSSIRVGGTDALRYGFIGSNRDGSPSELNLQYATIADEDFVLITAVAYDDGGCPGRSDLLEFDSRTLAALQPRLELALEHIPLPPSPR